MKNRDFIITSCQAWQAPFGSNAKDIAIELSHSGRVLYVNPVWKRSLIGRSQLHNINKNLWVLDYSFPIIPVNWLPDNWIFDLANRYNNFFFFKEINKYANRLSFQNIIHFCDNDIYRSCYARDRLKASLFIYYRRDNFHPVPYWQRHIKRLEPLIIKKSDIVMCNSSELTGYPLRYKAPKYVFNIGQGVDLSSYQSDKSYETPVECKSLRHPIIGYMGAITSSRLDIDLLYNIIEKRPQYTFIFVGESDKIFATHKINNLPNAHFLGLRPMAIMPTYVNIMDVCINPQLVNDVTIGNYPRKIDEYLALGKPVVATKTNTMLFFGKYVYLCNSTDEYLKAIDEAIASNTPQKQAERITYAHTHSWENCINKMHIIIDRYEETKPLQQR